MVANEPYCLVSILLCSRIMNCMSNFFWTTLHPKIFEISYKLCFCHISGLPLTHICGSLMHFSPK